MLFDNACEDIKHYTLFLCLQITRSDTRQQDKMVCQPGDYRGPLNLPQCFVWTCINKAELKIECLKITQVNLSALFTDCFMNISLQSSEQILN